MDKPNARQANKYCFHFQVRLSLFIGLGLCVLQTNELETMKRTRPLQKKSLHLPL